MALGGVGGVIWSLEMENCGLSVGDCQREMWGSHEEGHKQYFCTICSSQPSDPEHLGEHCRANRRGSIQTVAHNADIVLIKFPC